MGLVWIIVWVEEVAAMMCRMGGESGAVYYIRELVYISLEFVRRVYC